MGCLLSSDGLKSNPAKVEAITKRLKLADVEGAIISYNTNLNSFLSAQKSWNLYAVSAVCQEKIDNGTELATLLHSLQ